MTDHVLFAAADGALITSASLARDLRATGAADCDVLFVHSGMNLGVPNPELRRTGLLAEVWSVLLSLGVPTLCMPTFTFSFCNGDSYDIQRSPTRMGALNEYMRRLPEATRSRDPLMSVALVGREHELVTTIGEDAVGPGCTFDLLHRRGHGVKFLFLGVRCFECMTYTHYVESTIPVPFRYNRTFSGDVIDHGRSTVATSRLFVRYNGVEPTPEDKFERYLERTGRIRKQRLGDGWLSTVDEGAAFEALRECYDREPFYLAARPYTPGELRDTSFARREMVAL